MSTSAGTVQVAKRLKTMSEEERKVVKEILSFHNVKTGKETVVRYCKVFVPITVEKFKEIFALFEDDESFKAFRVFNVSQRSHDQDTDQMLKCRYKEQRNPLQEF